jgi:excisionase family DNA binding protein
MISQMTNPIQHPSLELLSGADEIASFLGVKPRRVYHLAETNRLPVFRLGTTICARRETLIRWVEDMERNSQNS